MNPELFEQSLNNIMEKIGEEQSAIIADDLGALRTAQNEALEKQKAEAEKFSQLQTTNQQLVAANAGLLQRIPVSEDNKLVPPSQTDTQPTQPPVDPFDEYGRLKK